MILLGPVIAEKRSDEAISLVMKAGTELTKSDT